MRDLGMPGPELRLIIFMAVPIEAEPVHSVKDRVNRRRGRTGPVGVLDPQQELAAAMPGMSQLNSAVRAPPMWR